MLSKNHLIITKLWKNTSLSVFAADGKFLKWDFENEINNTFNY